MIVSTVASTIAFATIIIVTVIITNQATKAKKQYEEKLRNVVDQVNTAQQYTYEFDKRQQQQVTGLERNVDDVRTSYITKADAASNLNTKKLNATNINGNNMGLSGSIQFNSDIDGASKSTDYVIQRGTDPLSKNHLVIRTPAEKGAALNIQTSDGFSRMLVDSTTGQVTIPANTKTNTLQLGDKFKLSGVGDVQGNDSWLRLMDKDGKDYYGGVAAANLWSQKSAVLNGNTTLNGTINVNGQTTFNNSVKIPNGNTLRVDGGIGKKAFSVGETGSLSVDSHGIAGGRFIINDAGNIGINQPNPLSKLDIKGDTNVSGKFTVKKGNGDWNWINVNGNHSDNIFLGSDGRNRGIWADGPRDFTIYNQGIPGLTVKQNGHVNIKDNLKIGHDFGGDWTDQASMTAWTTNGKAGASFGGPDNWSHFPWSDGNTYIRPGKAEGDINIDSAKNITLAANNIRANGNISTPHGNVINSDGRQYISGKELLYLLPKNGVVIGKENGGNGHLLVEGDAQVQGNINVGNTIKVRHSLGDWTNNAALTTWTPDETKIGAAFGGPDVWSYFPNYDGNTYIRPGKSSGQVLVGDTATSTVQIGDTQGQTEIRLGGNTKLPSSDGNSYIRPGRDGKNVFIGDTQANEVNLGRLDGSGAVYSRSTKNFVKQGIDAWDNKWDNVNNTLFTGWNSDKVILGNNSSAGEAYLKTLPKNTVASANNMYVNGKLSATNQLCINNTCLTEGNLQTLKSWM